jgi:hypothetical protein
MNEWKMKVSPERYLKQWPNGSKAKLARQLCETPGNESHDPSPVTSKVRFFSPRSNGLNIVVQAKEWFTQQTPGGSRTIQSEGKTAQFVNSIFVTEDTDIINYLTDTYNDKRFPVVREDCRTASVA